MPDPNRSGVVQSATGGKLLPPEGGFPLLGQTVEAGQVLAYVQPPFTAIDSSEIRQAMADLDKDIGLARAKLDRLRKGGNAVPRAQIEDAEIELDGLLKARADLESSAAPREALTAPVAGLVAAADVMAGRVVASGDTVFEIIDPQALWVEALAYDPRLTLGVTAASARTSGGVIMPLAFRGAGLATQNQAIPLRFSVEAPPPGLRTGMPVTVFLSLDAVRPGIAVPNAAVVRGLNGQPVVYVQTAAERFEARAVVAEPLDAGTMLVTAGLRPDARVVVSGAELVNQTR
jgi:multidrug efflux pump subunit AcrA (membrane-fusion protein)